MSMVFVLCRDRQPLDPCKPARARKLLSSGKAVVFRRYPFTILLKGRDFTDSVVHEHRLKIDPGSRTTGLAIVRDDQKKVIWAGELHHRGQEIRNRLLSRRAIRRSRRNRHTRYRKSRVLNRRRTEGWLAPSLLHRVLTIGTWVNRLGRYSPIGALSVETVRFDTQALKNPEISGVQYQQGTLHGYEVREYVLEKFGRRCAYCGANNVSLQMEHIVPRSRGGSDRVSNLTLACEPCNLKKGTRTAVEFGFPQIEEQAKLPLKDAAAVNSTRWRLYESLRGLKMAVECGSGGLTKFNRICRGLPKAHWIDASCVGASTPEDLNIHSISPLIIRATGHGSRQMCRVDRFGFPRTGPKQMRTVKGFRTGDHVVAVVPRGKYVGRHAGRVAIRVSGSFNIKTNAAVMQGISYRYCRRVHAADGYIYSQEKGGLALPPHA